MRIPRIPQAAFGPVLLASLLIILVLGHRPQPRPRLAPAWAVPGWFPIGWSFTSGTPPPTPSDISGQAFQRGKLNVTTADGLYGEDEQQHMADELEAALAYASNRFGEGPSGAIEVYVGGEPGCNLNGLAYTDRRLVQVFTCADLPRQRAVNILAHEFVHQLAHDYYGPPHLQADMILAEGVATWAAGKYWLGDQPSFAAFVRHHYQAKGAMLPLPTSYVGRPIADMNQLYYQWASFVEFLLETYGREKFDALYVSGGGNPGTAQYVKVYGKSLDELEREWLAWLGR